MFATPGVAAHAQSGVTPTPLAQRSASIRFPAGFTVPTSSVSPDGRYGVLVPDDATYDENVQQNAIVDMRTGHVVSKINAETGMLEMNHGGINPPRWSRDSSLLLWEVEGKWCPRALVLLKIHEDRVEYQLDLLHLGQSAILIRTRSAMPGKYAAAKKANAGNGSAYPDGFTVDVRAFGRPGSRVSLPMPVHATLTSNPKEIEDFPKDAQVDSSLDAVVTTTGKFRVTRFKRE